MGFSPWDSSDSQFPLSSCFSFSAFPALLHPADSFYRGNISPCPQENMDGLTAAQKKQDMFPWSAGETFQGSTRWPRCFGTALSPWLCSLITCTRTCPTDQGAEVPKAFLNFYFNWPESLNLIDFQIDRADQCTMPWRGRMVSYRTSSCTPAIHPHPAPAAWDSGLIFSCCRISEESYSQTFQLFCARIWVSNWWNCWSYLSA